MLQDAPCFFNLHERKNEATFMSRGENISTLWLWTE